MLRWRLHALLAERTDDLVHHFEAQRARPDLPPSAAALGLALARAGRPADAASHLREALAGNPLDSEVARALFHVLGSIGDRQGELRVVRDRYFLAQAALRWWLRSPGSPSCPPPPRNWPRLLS